MARKNHYPEFRQTHTHTMPALRENIGLLKKVVSSVFFGTEGLDMVFFSKEA